MTSPQTVRLGATPDGEDLLQVPIDPNGNLATKTEGSDTWAYTWNAENHLTKVEKNGAEGARFAYDPLGRRVEKVAGGVTTTYTYDSLDIIREVRGAATLKYVDGPGVDQPLAIDDGVAATYLHADVLGSIVRGTDPLGAVTLVRQYDAWGNPQSGGEESGPAFTGREWDPETGLYYYRARYYDPKIGRFLSEDPLGLRLLGHNGELANVYPYADGNPVLNVDPTGLLCVRIGTVEWTSTKDYPDKKWTLLNVTVNPVFKPYATCYWGKRNTTITWKHTKVHELCVNSCLDFSTRWTEGPSTKVSESQTETNVTSTGIDTSNGVYCPDPNLNGAYSGPYHPSSW